MAFQDNRFYVLDGPGSATTPTAGGHVDGVAEAKEAGASAPSDFQVRFGQGTRTPVEAGASFSSGADLATDGDGRAVAASSGDVRVARALESSAGAGSVVTVVLTAQATV